MKASEELQKEDTHVDERKVGWIKTRPSISVKNSQKCQQKQTLSFN